MFIYICYNECIQFSKKHVNNIRENNYKEFNHKLVLNEAVAIIYVSIGNTRESLGYPGLQTL